MPRTSRRSSPRRSPPQTPPSPAHPAGELSLTFGSCFVAQGWRLRQTLAWVKDAFVLGRSDYHYRHDPILYGHKPGDGRIGRGAAGWYGDNAQDSVLEVPRPRASREHPTMKPAELVERCLRNSTRRGERVLDPFAGSGSTLIACEAAGRTAGGAGAPVRCTATRKDGAPCTRPPLRGREVCHAHSGARVGRPSALTREVHERIVQLVKVGCPGEVAAQASGISAYGIGARRFNRAQNAWIRPLPVPAVPSVPVEQRIGRIGRCIRCHQWYRAKLDDL